jgi:hypothetical protein
MRERREPVGGPERKARSTCFPAGKSAWRGSQHPAAKEGVIQHQEDDCADGGYADAMNGGDVEAGHAAAAKKIKEPAANNRPNDAEQYIDDGSFARGADDLAYINPSTNPNRVHTIIDIRHSRRAVLRAL